MITEINVLLRQSFNANKTHNMPNSLTLTNIIQKLRDIITIQNKS